MEEHEAPKREDLTPAYVSFATFRTAIQSLRSHGLPEVIDRSAFASRSGADQGRIIGALRFLGLVDENNRTTSQLSHLVEVAEGSDAEKDLLADILRRSYTRVFREMDLTTATPMQLAEAIGSYGAAGVTRTRAVRFFLKAAEYAGVEISPRLKKGAVPPTPKPNRKTSARRTSSLGRQVKAEPTKTEIEPSPDYSITVKLPQVNGELTLTGKFNPLRLRGRERELVNKLADLMAEFEEECKKEGTRAEHRLGSPQRF